jgi:hypothetical protein
MTQNPQVHNVIIMYLQIISIPAALAVADLENSHITAEPI